MVVDDCACFVKLVERCGVVIEHVDCFETDDCGRLQLIAVQVTS